MLSIDLNCDMGESFGAYQIGNDDEIMDYVTSVNIACGFHAGDPGTMRKTVQAAFQKGVAVGAHPGLPDLHGFGRRHMSITAKEAYDMVVYQIGALNGFVISEGGSMHHVKPHGALYNMAAKEPRLAQAIAEAVYRINPQFVLYGLSGSELIKAGDAIGLQTASEVFADRGYEQDGSLTPRERPESVIMEESKAIQQVLDIVLKRKVVTAQGTELEIKADTICIHGDAPHSLLFARRIRECLESVNAKIQMPHYRH